MLLPKFRLKRVLVWPHFKRVTKNDCLHVEREVVRIVSVPQIECLGLN
jgi:hypothetical protein